MRRGNKIQIVHNISVCRRYSECQSVLSVLGACVKSGDEITLVCEGEDEQAAIDALVALIEGGLGE